MKIRKFDEDYAISWNGQNFDEIKEYLPEGHSIHCEDYQTLILDLNKEVLIGDYIVVQEVIRNDDIDFVVGVCSPELFSAYFDEINENEK